MLRFEPEYRAAVWGGRRLASAFSRALPEGAIGESWELADIAAHRSIARTGEHAGRPVGELWREGVLGGSASGGFPILVKWLDTHDWLSVQVHPDESYRSRWGEGEPKTEAWLVAECTAEAAIHLGHEAGLDELAFRQVVADGTVAGHLRRYRPRPGDLLLVPAGTLHAIGPGCLLLEVQQPSDTTYRAYDWGRLGTDGKPRTLHLDQACRATRFDRPDPPAVERHAIDCDAFKLEVLTRGARVGPGGLRVLAAHAGPAKLETERGGEDLAPGDVVAAETADGVVEVVGGACALLSEGTSHNGKPSRA